jgi:hypothetical protein
MTTFPSAMADHEAPATDENGFELVHGGKPTACLLETMPGADENFKGMKCESKRLYELERHENEIVWVDDMPEKFQVPALDDIEAARRDYAILLRTQLVQRQQKVHSIVVQSPLIKSALKGILNNYPGLFLQKDPLVFEAPFKAFVHRWDAFCAACERHDDLKTRQHLILLKENLEPELQPSFNAISNFIKYKVVEFEHLWAIYAPTSIIVAQKDKAECAFRVRKVEVKIQEDQKFLVIQCHYVDWDGEKFGRSLQVLAIAEYEGTAGLGELTAFPLEHHPDKAAIQEQLLERGRKFESLAGILYRSYEGIAYDMTQGKPAPKFVKGRIVIDPSKSGQLRSGSLYSLC